MNRRRFFKFLAGAAVVAGGVTAIFRPARANSYYSGPVSDHFDGQRFFLPGGDGPRSFRDFLRWQFGEKAAEWPASFPSPHPADMPPAKVEGDRLRVSFIGHASFLIQTGGVNILLDPQFSERASPVSFAGPKRVNPPAIAFDNLPKIDVVLVSHNHYDHLDVPSLHALWDRDRPRILTPLGNDAIIREGRADIGVEPKDWGDRVEFAASVAVIFEPAQHWSARGMFDRMHALWASFVIETGAGKIWFAGDTGFGGGRVFQAIREKHGPMALGLLPIGAYGPRWFMRYQHADPEDALKIFDILGCRHALGYHWGTFQLTNEPIEEPAEELMRQLAAQGRPAESFIPARPGHVFQSDAAIG
ncbi:MAG: MBL fold metallo-hydrolase [Methylobacterium sp.]|nr:MBL fold metallo-hydrolase [Methylobacterium sp.]